MMTSTVRLRWLVDSALSGPSPSCEDRVVEDPDEWGVLKTTAVQWDGWKSHEHKVLPKEFWGASRLAVQSGDVLITKAGPRNRVGVCVYVDHAPPRVVVSGKMVLLRANERMIDPRYLNYLLSTPRSQSYLDACKTGMAESQMNFANDDLMAMRVDLPGLSEQRKVANFLDAETAIVHRIIDASRRTVELVEERVESRIASIVSASRISRDGSTPALPVRRLLRKLARSRPTPEVVTAYRDGQVTARKVRRQEGYTESSSSDFSGQGVEIGDLVIHGLDGFSGAIGDSEASGTCSPVYHVCLPCDGGSSVFYGRLLRFLAIDGYLSLFAISTRERAVDFRNWGRFGAIPLPVVAPSLQSDIADEILSARPLKAVNSEFAARLLERQRSLVVAAVTGQIDVTTARGVDV